MSECLKFKKWVVCSLVYSTALAADDAEFVAPVAFTNNCQVCHTLDRAVVGPSLVEISEIYPEKNRSDFISWCIEPGKKRYQMPQMPSMAHISEGELNNIFEYIKRVTVGVKRVKVPASDPYEGQPRPRIERTFVPNSGPASMIVALATEEKLNLIWDTDQCRLRYISEGETNNWPYLRSNGNSLAEVGTICYVEKNPVFTSSQTQYVGYELSVSGYPTFYYKVDDALVSEEITVDRESLVRTISASNGLPDFVFPKDEGGTLKIETRILDDALVITHSYLR